MAHHIIIDGIDKTGKSTLARHLSKKLNMPIKKFSAPDKNPLMEYAEFIINKKRPHIIDRCYLSELAYGPVKRGKSYINKTEQFMLEAAIRERGCFCIYAVDLKSKITERFDKDKETFLKKSEIPAILEAFDLALKRSILDWTHYAIGDSMDQLVLKYLIDIHCYEVISGAA